MLLLNGVPVHSVSILSAITCADPESFVRGGPTLTAFFFLVDEGREDQNNTKSEPSLAR